MAAIRISAEHWSKTHKHLFSKPGEHFAFFLAKWTHSAGRPVFLVNDVILVSDDDVEITRSGWVLSHAALLHVVNAAVKAGAALIEVHNHGGTMPRFSATDRAGFREFVPYVLDSLRNRPYGATVWGDETAYGEYFAPNGTRGVIDSIVVQGEKLEQRVSRDDDDAKIPIRFDRQAPWFTAGGQRQLGRFKFGIVGLGGNGGPVVQNLVYLGARDFVLVDHDDSSETNMNRLVTATAADIGTPKVILARRMIKLVAPDAKVHVIQKRLESGEALDALKGVDVLVSCPDNDGVRVILNELALAYRVPYFDLGIEIEANDGRVEQAGGRLAVVLPDGPCLYCMNQIDADEARYSLSSKEEQDLIRRQGYVTGMDVDAPSVVGLNAAIAAAAVNELAIYLSGLRPVRPLTFLDLLRTPKGVKAQSMGPGDVARKPGCPACEAAGAADASRLERYHHI